MENKNRVMKFLCWLLEISCFVCFLVGLVNFYLIIDLNSLSQTTPELNMIQQRKVASSFREQALLQIYEISLQSLLGQKADGNLFTYFREAF